MNLESQVVSLDLAKRLKEVCAWKVLPGYENLYEVSDNGLVRSITRSGSDGRVLKQHPVKGYLQVWLSKNNKVKKMAVHTAVALAFCGPKLHGYCVNHKDGNKLNNSHFNLEWCTRAENEAHKRNVLGKDDKGKRNGHFGYRKAKLYPSEELRNKLCSLGVPRWRHNLAELGEMLPFEAYGDHIFESYKLPGFFEVRYGRLSDGKYSCAAKAQADTEANARAKMLIHLIESGLMKP